MEWDDLKKVDDVLYPTYRDACYARGLLQDDKEYIDGILKASLWGMGDYLRSIFVMLIMTNRYPRPRTSDIQRKNICLSYINCMLRSNNRSLKDIQNMPYPDQEYTMDGYNRLIYDETSYNKDQLREQHVKLKTYLYKTMSDALHSKGDIVLNVASSSIAALLLEGDENEYEFSDFVCLVDEDSNFDDLIYTTEFLNGLRMSGIPNHNIKLKICTPIMLMRNNNQRAGLCNETRLQVLRMGINIIEAQIISGGSVGMICAIPRMVISPSDIKMSFKLNRRQFPIQVCFAMTINKRQG
ncbi:ATP-dependent DNA helicase PIF1-like protein [Tanacetum coccineum]